MKKRSSQKILAIDPGTKNMGVAFFEGRELVYFGVKTIKRLKSPPEILKEGKRVILRIISDFKPDILVVEKTQFLNNKRSKLLNKFTSVIQSIGRRKGLAVHSFASNTVRKGICGNGNASKDEVAKVVLSGYQELRPYLTSDKKWKEIFHRNMFDAVALGLYVHKITETKI